jgi:hypothetical protein
MKYIITENQYNLLLEQGILTTPLGVGLSKMNPITDPIFEKIVKWNKRALGLIQNSQITPEYLKKMNEFLAKANVKPEKRTLMGSLVGFIPIYETALDIESIVDGIVTGNYAKIKGGTLGLSNAGFSYKALTSLIDYFDEKVMGKKSADDMEIKREAIVNMSPRETQELFRRYGYGGYDKWVKAGKPKL